MTAIDHTEESGKKTEIIAFSSGKGGTGKTLIATCLGYALRKIGLRVLMIDSDTATDGLSLYLLGPAGLDKVNGFPLGSTLTGILRQFKEQGNFQFQPWKINRSAKEDHGVTYEAIISGRQLYGDRFEAARDDSSIQLDRDSYRKVIQTMFDSLRAKAEYDYVIVDTRGGFSSESNDVSALADSYIVVTEADVTSFYQNRNLIQYIDQAASNFDKKAILRSIIVNKSTQFTSATSDFDLDNLESSFRLQLEREFPIDYKATHPFPLSFEALTVQKSHKIPIRHALDSDFSYTFLVAFHNILSVVTQPWTQEQVAEWNYLVESVNLAIQKRNEGLEKAEREEQEQHKELEKLQKDNSEYANRISFLERELKEIDERYKRELERSQLIVSKLEGEKVSPAQIASKQVTKSRRNLAPGIIAISIFGVLVAFGVFRQSILSIFAASPVLTATLTEAPLLSATESATVQAIEITQTASPTAIQVLTETLVATPTDCPPFVEGSAILPNNAHFVADLNYPNGSTLSPGTRFEKKWYIQNIGKNTWNTNYVVAYGGESVEERMQAASPIYFSKDVPPGLCLEIAIVMTAPQSPGNYTGVWVLQSSASAIVDGQETTRFGFEEKNVGSLDVAIVVSSPTQSPTPSQ